MKFREVNYFATVDEFHALFIYLHILYVFIYVYMYVYPLLLKEFNLYYKYEYKTLSTNKIRETEIGYNKCLK